VKKENNLKKTDTIIGEFETFTKQPAISRDSKATQTDESNDKSKKIEPVQQPTRNTPVLPSLNKKRSFPDPPKLEPSHIQGKKKKPRILGSDSK
jgi:hypothetical protein